MNSLCEHRDKGNTKTSYASTLYLFLNECPMFTSQPRTTSVSHTSSWLYYEILKWMTYLCLSLPPLVHNEFSCEYETLIWFLSMVHIHYKYLFRRKNKQVGKYVAKNWKWKKLHWFCMVKYDIYFESFQLVISWKIKLLFLKNVIWSLIFTIFVQVIFHFNWHFPKFGHRFAQILNCCRYCHFEFGVTLGWK